jgi:multiple sugar transport system substrate-binding protein
MKRSWKTISTAGAALLLTTTLLGACSTGGGAASEPASADQETKGGESGGASQEPVTLRLTLWGSPSEVETFETAIGRFEERFPYVTVKLENIPADYDTKMTTMIAGGEEPDVAMLESATLAFPLAEQGKLINLEEYLATDPGFPADGLVPNISYYAEPGNLIGLGPGPEIFMLYYNVDMFKAAGVAPPSPKVDEAWTWDEFVEVAKKLTIDENGNDATSPNFDPEKIKQYGINGANGWWGAWSNFVYSNGGDFLSEDGTKFALNEPAAAEALQRVADLINVHHVAPSPIAAKNVPGTNVALQTKKVAMVIDGQWANSDLGSTDVNYDVAPLPVMGEPVTTVVAGMFSIFSSTEHPKEAWELVKALLDPEGSLELNHKGLWMPALSSWYEDPALLDKWTKDSKGRTPGYRDTALDMLMNHSHQTPTGYVKNFNKIMDLVNPALDKVWLGEQTAKEALDAIAPQAQAQVQGRRDK